jgi:lipid II:glycine glycyltransferase (peptidoglycan interpeptide bridge formation enzyme)
LVDSAGDLAAMYEYLTHEIEARRWRSWEVRLRSGTFLKDGGRPFRVAESAKYYLHELDLTEPAERIFSNFHRTSMQQAVRRAEREGLTCEAGTSPRLLAEFYRLFRLSRRRHGLPPQPNAWFRNLQACLGDRLAVYVARKDGQAIASMLMLSFKRSMVYKYSGSDAAYNALGGMPFLLWQAIERGQANGAKELDLGRSDLDQPGLIAFKDHLGATRSTLTYYTCPERRAAAVHSGRLAHLVRKLVPLLPDAALDLTGRVLYRHLG